MESTKRIHKSNPFLLSEQVKSILRKKGFSAVFNYSDYTHFKEQCQGAYNKAMAIAEKFIEEATPENNDLNNYIF